MLHTFLLVIQIILSGALVAVILMQRSEGGGLVSGGGGGLMSARGAGDFLTRMTAILAALFILNSIGLAVLASVNRAPRAIDTSLAVPAPVQSNLPAVPSLDGAGQGAQNSAASPAGNESAPVPLAN